MEIFPLLLLLQQQRRSIVFCISTTPKRWRWQFENSCLGVHLHTVALCYCYLMSSITLSFGRRWGEYRTPWLNQFNFIPRRYRVSFHVSMSVCRALAGARTLSEWHSDTSTVRDGQRADSQAARPDIRMLLRSQSHPRGMPRWGWFTSLLEPFCAFKVLGTVQLNETAVSLDY